MDKYTSNRAIANKETSDILKIADLAKQDIAKGNQVINASIGVFLNNNKTLNIVNEVTSSLNKHICDDLSYPSLYGSLNFKIGVLKWLFKDLYPLVVKKYLIPFGATLGGTGACHISFSNYLDEGETILLPSIMWSNYLLIAEKSEIKTDTYSLFNEKNKFNILSLKQKIEEYASKQKRILIVINDPCQNPTGYCLDDEEYQQLFSMLDDLGQRTSITVLFDIAYLCYDLEDNNPHRVFTNILKDDHNFLPLFAFSASKAFGMYGLRVGALFALCNDKEIYDNFMTSFSNMARGVYSCPNGPALTSLSAVLNNEQSLSLINENIKVNSDILFERGQIIKTLLDENGIKYLPYQKGFFITIYCENSQFIYDSLIKKHIYIVPLNKNYFRVALSGLSKNEIYEFVKELKSIINL